MERGGRLAAHGKGWRRSAQRGVGVTGCSSLQAGPQQLETEAKPMWLPRQNRSTMTEAWRVQTCVNRVAGKHLEIKSFGP